jgi:hypothetical protein
LGAKDLFARFTFYHNEIPFAGKSGLFGADPVSDKLGVIPRLFIIRAVLTQDVMGLQFAGEMKKITHAGQPAPSFLVPA